MFDLVPFESSAGSIFDTFDRMLNSSFFGGVGMDTVPFRTDIVDEGDRYVLKADLPGFSKEDINISVDGGRLQLSAEHKEESGGDQKNYVRRERRYSAYSRSFDLQGIDAEKISASYRDGVLSLNLPKLIEAKPESRKIEVK
ncbi:18 kDa heat shock protein [Caprobacter fermentans]|uniref:18 kDa heat shock protein n=1 Tax=Caproicibacter fermentans TaxID=2576756 RepID=A0A6N8HXV7_9FIRM|nr:Hsp20/alpha crystallin family protein [Caproicibacter fermentans]MVB10307.1 18 kDa heat shock protein [Caproicibacter fermentans]